MSKDTVYESMWSRISGFFSAMRNPTKSVGYNGETKHPVKMVDGGNTRAVGTRIIVDDEGDTQYSGNERPSGGYSVHEYMALRAERLRQESQSE